MEERRLPRSMRLLLGNFTTPGLWGIESAEMIGEISPRTISCRLKRADLMFLPQRRAFGQIARGRANPAGGAVSAILPAGYTRLYLAFLGTQPHLMICNDALSGSGFTRRHSYGENDLAGQHYDACAEKCVHAKRWRLLKRRLVDHLAHCALTYHLHAAQKFVYHRWEAGIRLPL